MLKWPRLVQSNYGLHFFINYWVDHENQGLYSFNQINFIHFGEDWGNYKMIEHGENLTSPS